MALKLPCITAAHWGSGEGGTPTVPWKNAPSATTSPRAFDSVILIEALERGAATDALTTLRFALDLADLQPDFGADVYDLTFVFPGSGPCEPLRHRRRGWSGAAQ